MNIPAKAVTLRHSALARAIVSEVKIAEAFDPRATTHHPPYFVYKAIWDTGATNSVISSRVVSDLKLKSTGLINVGTTGGKQLQAQYYVNIVLRNDVGVPFVPVTEGILEGIDVLIGMDIIARGDFAITNLNRKTVFSFQMPSTHDIDFVKEASPKPIINSSSKTKPNDLCHCGSNIKFKKCCGRSGKDSNQALPPNP